ncbi:MAG TPA: neutral/alkaline non-lysosomal ceramidase N-terminal domain-containing protein, partial [Solirubrobacteraceae bacterium]
MRSLAAVLVALALAVVLAAASPAGAAPGPRLKAGAGRADITPPRTGYYLGGWTRADRRALGQHTRLFARTLVLQRGGRRIALVALDLFMVPAGMQQQIAELAGFDERDVLISVTHTHSGPGGYANFPTYNTAAPSTQTATTPTSFTDFFDPQPADRQLYTFLARQITLSIQRATADLGRAVAGWGDVELLGVTRNRSIEAHLADHGIEQAFGTGSAAEDPDGERHTVAPDVDVLRVDKVRCRKHPGRRKRCRHVPIGAWSEFADHGTVVKSEFQAYDADHHATAHRVFEAKVRKRGKVPGRQEVVNVYGNAEEGDQSAGLDHTGPAGAEEVGRAEAGAMLAAWRRARRRMSSRPALDVRATRACFCGRETSKGRVASKGVPGIPFFTGSEEGRGPLYDVTRTPFEGRRSEQDDPEQGHKLMFPAGDFPAAVPLTVVRIGDRMIASLPGEPTKEVGVRVKAAVAAAARPAAPIRRVVIAGLADDYLSYITTPEEYSQQHYEGGSTLFGPLESVFLQERLADLAGRLVRGEPAPGPDPFDAVNGVRPDGPEYPPGATSGRIVAEPAEKVGRLERATLGWEGGPAGADRPVGAPFVLAERRDRRGRWRRADSDLGLAMLWRADDRGRYDAAWEVPRRAKLGTYRLVVSAAGYRLESRPFAVVASGALSVQRVDAAPGRAAVRVAYPPAVENVDLTWRPAAIDGGEVRFRVGDREVVVRRRHGAVFEVEAPAGA